MIRSKTLKGASIWGNCESDILHPNIILIYICIWMHRIKMFASWVHRKSWKIHLVKSQGPIWTMSLWNVCCVYFDLITSRITKDTLAYTHYSHQNNEFLVYSECEWALNATGLFDNELPLFNDLCHKLVQCKRSRPQKPKSTQLNFMLVSCCSLRKFSAMEDSVATASESWHLVYRVISRQCEIFISCLFISVS